MRAYMYMLADCVVLPIRRHYYYSESVFLLPFFVSAPETVHRIQGPLTTRVIVGPSPTPLPPPPSFASPPDPFRLRRHQKVPHDLFFTIIMFFISLRRTRTHTVIILYRLCTDAVPKRKHTSGCVSLFISSWLIIIPSSTLTHARTHMHTYYDGNGSATTKS